MPHGVGLMIQPLGGTIALPGYFIADTPWAGTKSNTNWANREQASTRLAGGRLITGSSAQNNLFTQDHYLATGTYKVALIYTTDSSAGIHNITGISGTQTIDGYTGGAQADNNYAEVTGIAVTAGVKTVVDTMATKNASASAYQGYIQTYAIVRTGA